MPRRRKPTVEEILRVEVCGCSTVKKIIDQAASLAMAWYERDDCDLSKLASTFLAIRVLQQLFIQMADDEEEAAAMAELILNTRDLADHIEEDCQPYIQKFFTFMVVNKKGIPPHATLQ